ncbi:hypothetical protein KCP70_07315 [Salmonella enterica subsp. enterica]|nr:hypothetical protein KCP70_07315 [Salmonella enterica subsp. enterica]
MLPVSNSRCACFRRFSGVRRGRPLFMTLQRAHWSLQARISGLKVNGRYLGPTMRTEER